jgi:hypothetical protein
VFTILGALVQEVKTNANNINLDLSAHSPGLYFITIFNENGSSSKEIIKDRCKRHH